MDGEGRREESLERERRVLGDIHDNKGKARGKGKGRESVWKGLEVVL